MFSVSNPCGGLSHGTPASLNSRRYDNPNSQHRRRQHPSKPKNGKPEITMWNSSLSYLWRSIDWLQTYNGAVTAFATVWIAVFTLVLAFVSRRQAMLTRQSIKLATKEFVSTHRPKIIVRELLMMPNIDPIQIRYVVANVRCQRRYSRRKPYRIASCGAGSGVAPPTVSERSHIAIFFRPGQIRRF